MSAPRSVLLLGADGFNRARYRQSLAGQWMGGSQRGERTIWKRWGFRTLRADLADPACHDPTFWEYVLSDGRAVVNVAGLLSGPEAAFKAFRVQALDAALPPRQPTLPTS